jgi:hypothetical protein
MQTKYVHFTVGMLCVMLAFPVRAFVGEDALETVMPPVAVDPDGDVNVFSSPFYYRNGMIFVVHVEPPPAGMAETPLNLRTVVRKGVLDADGRWQWQATTLEPRTLKDGYHTQGSIALDRKGYVHVVYNMHDMPWQYSVSRLPYDIRRFEFRGQSLSQEMLAIVKLENRSPFPDVGSAAIPGNQITYPRFFVDRKGELYITYRYSLRPARHWGERAFGGGLARYDTATRRWKSLGGALTISKEDAQLPGDVTQYTQHPFAFDEHYIVLYIELAFDKNNGMHAIWTWRYSGPGGDTVKPSYAYSPDGGAHFYRADHKTLYTLPINYADADEITDVPGPYWAEKAIAAFDPEKPELILFPIGGPRRLFSRVQPSDGHYWQSDGDSPWGATDLVIDKEGVQWLIASGLKIFTRKYMWQPWVMVLDMQQQYRQPRVEYVSEENALYIHAKSGDYKSAVIFKFNLK